MIASSRNRAIAPLYTVRQALIFPAQQQKNCDEAEDSLLNVQREANKSCSCASEWIAISLLVAGLLEAAVWKEIISLILG